MPGWLKGSSPLTFSAGELPGGASVAAVSRESRGAGELDGALATLSSGRSLWRLESGADLFANSLRLDWEPRGIAVTVVSPGFVDTPLTRKNDFSMPGQVSVEQAVKAIRRGLAKGHDVSPSRRAFACFCACWPGFLKDFSAGYCAGWCVHENRDYWQRHCRADLRLAPCRATRSDPVRSGVHAGGHTATVDIATPQGTWAIDTGFIVYNDRTYPRFMGLLNELGLSGQKTQMSFSVHNPQSGLEYNGHSLSSLFAQRRNLLKPAFWGLLTEIVRFNRLAKQALAGAFDPGATLQTFLERHRFSPFFARHYILPMGAAIWSSSLQGDAPLPAGAVLALL